VILAVGVPEPAGPAKVMDGDGVPLPDVSDVVDPEPPEEDEPGAPDPPAAELSCAKPTDGPGLKRKTE
jgi:hypothetical protein